MNRFRLFFPALLLTIFCCCTRQASDDSPSPEDKGSAEEPSGSCYELLNQKVLSTISLYNYQNKNWRDSSMFTFEGNSVSKIIKSGFELKYPIKPKETDCPTPSRFRNIIFEKDSGKLSKVVAEHKIIRHFLDTLELSTNCLVEEGPYGEMKIHYDRADEIKQMHPDTIPNVKLQLSEDRNFIFKPNSSGCDFSVHYSSEHGNYKGEDYYKLFLRDNLMIEDFDLSPYAMSPHRQISTIYRLVNVDLTNDFQNPFKDIDLMTLLVDMSFYEFPKVNNFESRFFILLKSLEYIPKHVRWNYVINEGDESTQGYITARVMNHDEGYPKKIKFTYHEVGTHEDFEFTYTFGYQDI